jgi:hypothetical protein
MTTKLAAALTGVLFLICSHWYAYCAGGRNYTAALKLEYAHATKKADDAARKQERQFSDQLKKAQDDAKNREKKLLADAAAARTESSRLHDTLADFQRKLPNLTEQAVRQYADAASVVFDQCQKQYLDMAETADRIDSDRQTLEDAWPK